MTDDGTPRPVRVGLVGCGQIAQIMHLPFLSELPEFEIVALCDLSRETAEAMAHRYRARVVTTSSDELVCHPEVDAVIVCSYDHSPVALAALQAGKHVLIEKPLAFTVAEGRQLVAVSQAAGTVAMVGYMKLFDPGFEQGLRLFAEVGEHRVRTVHDFAGRFDVAKVIYEQERFSDVDPAVLEAGRREVTLRIGEHLRDAGAAPGHEDLYTLLLMLGAHDLSVVRAAFGTPDRVAHASSRDPKHLLAVLEYDDAAPVVLEMGTGTGYDWWDEWVSVGTDSAEVKVSFSHPYVRYAPTTVSLHETRFGMGSASIVTAPPDDPFRRELRAFARAVRSGGPVVSTVAGALEDLELATAIVATLPARTAERTA